jgi:hypothetical protein
MPIFKLLEGGLDYVTNGAQDGWGSMVDAIFLKSQKGYKDNNETAVQDNEKSNYKVNLNKAVKN